MSFVAEVSQMISQLAAQVLLRWRIETNTEHFRNSTRYIFKEKYISAFPFVHYLEYEIHLRKPQKWLYRLSFK